jgi:ferritin-like metal-binding protein YciE
MNVQTIEDLFVEQIKDLYDAEQRLMKALPKMAESATNNELKSAISDHLRQTEGHVQRLEQVFAEIGQDPAKETCEAMKGLIKEGEEMMDIKEPAIRDAALIAAANRVEHYEIAAYGTARTLATGLGLKQSPGLLEQTLAEEKQADAKLTQIAEQTVNQQAAQPRTRTAR